MSLHFAKVLGMVRTQFLSAEVFPARNAIFPLREQVIQDLLFIFQVHDETYLLDEPEALAEPFVASWPESASALGSKVLLCAEWLLIFSLPH